MGLPVYRKQRRHGLLEPGHDRAWLGLVAAHPWWCQRHRNVRHQWANAIGAKGHRHHRWTGKQEFCRSLRGRGRSDYHADDFTDAVLDATGGAGVDVILDIMGAKYLDANVASLALRGRLVIIGLKAGSGELNLRQLLIRGGTIHATSLRRQIGRREGGHLHATGHGGVAADPATVRSDHHRRRGAVGRTSFRATRRLDQPDHPGRVVLSWT